MLAPLNVLGEASAHTGRFVSGRVATWLCADPQEFHVAKRQAHHTATHSSGANQLSIAELTKLVLRGRTALIARSMTCLASHTG